MRSEARVVITNPTGLHARPAVKLAQLAAGFDARIEVRAGDDGEWVRARSTARVMKLKAGPQSTIHFRAEGSQADDALSALVDFVRRDFDEGPAAAPESLALGGRAAPTAPDTVEGRDDSGPEPREASRACAVQAETPGERVLAAAGSTAQEGRTISAVVASPGLAIGIVHMPAPAPEPATFNGANLDDASLDDANRQAGDSGNERAALEEEPADPESASAMVAAGTVGRISRRRNPTSNCDVEGDARGDDARNERAAFEEAIACAIERLRALADESGGLARDIIGFQVSLLEDEEFLDPVRAEIDAGLAADRAWARHLAREIADYESAPADYLRDRAADLRDLRTRVATAFAGDTHRDPLSELLPEHCIVIADELTPSRFLELDRSRVEAVATCSGSTASHVAMLARAHGLPMLVRLACGRGDLTPGAEAIVDAERGCLVLRPSTSVRERYARRIEEGRARDREAAEHASRPARTRDGTPVRVLLNVDDPAGLAGVDPSHCDGVGLTRTEFLFHGVNGLPDEGTQLDFYRRLVAWAGGRPVTVRTLDAGGDKPIPGLTIEDESNPFLGLRGVRLSLSRPEVLATQLRALARAAAGGDVKVMLPMVTKPEELDEVRRLLAGEVRALRAAGIEAAAPRLGMMVEVPAAALTIERFDAEFFSIGTNDLAQYVLAAGRDSTAVADLLDPLHPAVLELISRVADAGARTGREVSVCGEMAARPECLRALLDAGIRTFSVPPTALARTKAAFAAL